MVFVMMMTIMRVIPLIRPIYTSNAVTLLQMSMLITIQMPLMFLLLQLM